MKINFSKTRENMRLLKIGAWARHHGLSEPTVRRILGGKYPFLSGPMFDKCIEALREDGYLVEEEDEPEIKVA